MSRRSIIGAILLTGPALVFPACQSTTGPASTLTKSALFAKANAICRRANIRRDTFDETKSRAYFISQLAVEETAESSELKALVPPASMARDWGRFTEGLREFAADASKLEGYVKSNASNPPSALVAAAARAQEQALTTAKRAGLVECSKTDLH